MRGEPVAKDVDAWMARQTPAHRAALEKLRAQIRAAAPGAEEVISYGMPAYKLHGHLVAFCAFRNHLSFFPMSSTLIAKTPEAAPFATGTGTMQFQPDAPIPAALVKKLVKARIAQNLETASERAVAKKKKAAARKKRKEKRGPLSRTALPSTRK